MKKKFIQAYEEGFGNIPVGAPVVGNDGTIKVQTASGASVVANETSVTTAIGAALDVWKANTAVKQGEVKRATLAVGTIGVGDFMSSNSDRTTGATFDVTEAANWTELANDPDALIVTQVAGGTNINTLTTPGIYRSNTNVSAVNGAEDHWGWTVEVMNGGATQANRIIQVWYSASNGQVYSIHSRTSVDTGSTWSAWRLLSGNSTDGTINAYFDRLRWDGATLITGTNLNDLAIAGFYDGQTLTNAPNGATGWFYIIHQRHSNLGSSQYHHQTAYALGSGTGSTTGEVYVRTNAGGTWSAWARIDNAAIPSATDGTTNAYFESIKTDGVINLTASSDLNTLTDNGVFNVNTPSNAPVAVGWWYIEHYKHRNTTVVDGNYAFQRALRLDTTANTWYYRMRMNGTWTGWVTVASTVDITNSLKKPIRAYSATETAYAVDEIVIQDLRLYRCKTAITAAEAFTVAKWDEISVGATGAKKNTIHITTSVLAITEALHNTSEIHFEGTANATIDATAITTDTFGFSMINTDAPADRTLTPTGFAGVFLRDGSAIVDLGNVAFTIGQNEKYNFTVTLNGGQKYLNIESVNTPIGLTINDITPSATEVWSSTKSKTYADALVAQANSYKTYSDADVATDATRDGTVISAVVTPVLTASGAIATGNAFASNIAETHASTKWEIEGVMGTADVTNKLSFTPPATAYTAIADTAAVKAAYIDSNGNQSQRSSAVNTKLSSLSIAMPTSYPTDTVSKTFDHSTVALELGNIRSNSFSNITFGGVNFASQGLVATVMPNSVNLNVANEATLWLAVFEATFTKAIKLKLVITAGNVVINVIEAAYWAGDVTASTAWTSAGGTPASKNAATIATSDTNGAYGLRSLTINFGVIQGAAIVPAMTANTGTGTALGFIASASTEYDALRAAKGAFDQVAEDGSSNNIWAATGTDPVNQWIRIQLPTARIAKSCAIGRRAAANANFRSILIQGSNDGTTWTDLATTQALDLTVVTIKPIRLEFAHNITAYTYYRMFCATSTGLGAGIDSLQFFE